MFEEVDVEGVISCTRGLCKSHCSYAGVIACVFVDTSCGCPKTLVCELSHRVAKCQLLRCTVVKLAYAFKEYREVKKFLSQCQLMKNTNWYIESALAYFYDDHISAVLYSKERVTCLVPYDLPSDLLREYSS